jgi:hypothetical protein
MNLSSCSGENQTKDIQPAEIAPVENDSTVKAEQLKEVVELVALQKNFTFDRDEIYPDRGWYTHVQQTASNSWNRNYLEVNVNAQGNRYLSSHYYGDDWIFHTLVRVRIGESVYTSEVVPTYSSNHRTSVGSGSVWEENLYLGTQGNGIIDALQRASVSDAIVVRFEGDERAKTFTLSKRDIQAIQKSARLSQLLRKGLHHLTIYDSVKAAKPAVRVSRPSTDTVTQSEGLRDYNTRVWLLKTERKYYCSTDYQYNVGDGEFIGEAKAIQQGFESANKRLCHKL